MKLRDSAAGAMAVWQAMTMTGAYAPAAPAVPASPDQGAVSAWSAMTNTTPTAPASIPSGPSFQAGTPGGFAVKVPAKPGAGAWGAPISGEYAGMGPATTPLVDNPTQLPALPAAKYVPSTATQPPAALTDRQALDLAGYDPSLSPQAPPPQPGDNRALTVDEKRFAQGNPLLSEAYKQGDAVAPHLAAAGMKPILDDTKQPGIRRDGYTLAASETFDNGKGLFSRAWGPGVDTSVPGQITMHRVVENGQEMDSGAMFPPTGRDAGYGYGLYSFDLSMTGSSPGPYALLWPGTDVWPGPEMDLVERLPGGALYSTLHWDANPGVDGNGDNKFASIGMDGIDGSQRHTYEYLWEPNRLTVYVDGRAMGSFTGNVPKSAADGGENAAPGIGMQTWWSKGDQAPCSGVCSENSITLYGFSYERAP